MGNLKLTLPPLQIVRQFKSQIVKAGVCQNVTQEVTEILPPLDCVAGDKMILFLKSAALSADGSGVFVGSIMSRNLVGGNYEYWVSYADSLLASGISIDQCDILKPCCYTCEAEFLCLLMLHPDCEAVQDCVAEGMNPEDGLDYDDTANRFSVAISQDPGNNVILKADGLYATTTVAGEIDPTLRRDDGGILGVANTAEPASGHSRLFGIMPDGSGVRIGQIAASAGMSGASTSYNVGMASLAETVIDYDQIDYDPLNTITPGADWHFTAPVTGRYLLHAGILLSNEFWGGFGPSGYAGINLFYTKNGGSSVPFGGSTVWDRSMTVSVAAPFTQGSILLDLAAGDEIQILVYHSDNNMPPDTHKQVAHPLSRFQIIRVL